MPSPGVLVQKSLLETSVHNAQYMIADRAVETGLEIPASGINFMALAPAPECVGPQKTEKHCNISTTRLPHNLGLWNRNP